MKPQKQPRSIKELSNAQRQLLLHMVAKPAYVADYYPPAKKLVALGLCIWLRDCLVPTDTGLALVNESR